MRLAQGCSHPREIVCMVPVLTNAYGPLKPGEGVVQLPLAEGQQTNSIRSTHESRGVRHRLGNPQPLPYSQNIRTRLSVGDNTPTSARASACFPPHYSPYS